MSKCNTHHKTSCLAHINNQILWSKTKTKEILRHQLERLEEKRKEILETINEIEEE